MIEDENDTAPAEAAPQKSNKKLFAIVGAVVLVLALGAGAFFYFSRSGAGEETELLESDLASVDGLAPAGDSEEDELEEGEEAVGGIFPLETFVVNLQGGKFLRCQVQIEFNERDVPKRFYVKLVPIRDALITLLSSRTAEDLSGARGRGTLKSEIKDLVNEIMRREDVRRVYFTQFLVQ